MTIYTEEHKQAVAALIDNHTSVALDVHSREAIKTVAFASMDDEDKKFTAIEIADIVCDYIIQNFSGDVYMATVCWQMCPKDIVLALRSEIIKALP